MRAMSVPRRQGKSKLHGRPLDDDGAIALKRNKPRDDADENKKDVERLIRLCIELDVEMDGVRVPATAAAILNAIRSILDKHR
jgi:hypothetical protein